MYIPDHYFEFQKLQILFKKMNGVNIVFSILIPGQFQSVADANIDTKVSNAWYNHIGSFKPFHLRANQIS